MQPVGLLLALCAAIPALAQDATRPPLVGVLSVNTAANNEQPATALRDALAALGDIDGKSIRLDFWFWPRATLDGSRNWQKPSSATTRASSSPTAHQR